jgi:hypothetical protein
MTLPEAPFAERTSPAQPFPIPTEALQHRAIGLLRGIYKPYSAEEGPKTPDQSPEKPAEDEEKITQGTLTTSDNVVIDAVLLGRVISLVRNHLDLSQEYLWVVYPRTRETGGLHAQIIGVWSPEGTLHVVEEPAPSPEANALDGFFSIRGEVVFYSRDEHYALVKIRQQKKKNKLGKAFKLRIEGSIPENARNKFWDFEVRREGEKLSLLKARFVAGLPPKKFTGRPGQRPSSPTGSGSLRSPRPERTWEKKPAP